LQISTDGGVTWTTVYGVETPYNYPYVVGEDEVLVRPIRPGTTVIEPPVLAIVGTAPALAPMVDGQTLGDAVSWGSARLSVPAGSPPLATDYEEMRLNFGAWTPYSPFTVVSAGQFWDIRRAYTASGITRVFQSAQVAVAYVPPSVEQQLEALTLAVGSAVAPIDLAQISLAPTSSSP
jgi:hypothetical protein